MPACLLLSTVDVRDEALALLDDLDWTEAPDDVLLDLLESPLVRFSGTVSRGDELLAFDELISLGFLLDEGPS